MASTVTIGKTKVKKSSRLKIQGHLRLVSTGFDEPLIRNYKESMNL